MDPRTLLWAELTDCVLPQKTFRLGMKLRALAE